MKHSFYLFEKSFFCIFSIPLSPNKIKRKHVYTACPFVAHFSQKPFFIGKSNSFTMDICAEKQKQRLPLHTAGEALVFPNVILQLSALFAGKEPQRSGCAEYLARVQHCAGEVGETG